MTAAIRKGIQQKKSDGEIARETGAVKASNFVSTKKPAAKTKNSLKMTAPNMELSNMNSATLLKTDASTLATGLTTRSSDLGEIPSSGSVTVSDRLSINKGTGLPKILLAIGLESAVILLGSLPEGCSNIEAAGYFQPESGKLIICSLPEKGGLIISASQTLSKNNNSTEEKFFLVYLPISPMQITKSVAFGVLQANKQLTRYLISVTPYLALTPPIIEALRKQFGPLLMHAVQNTLPVAHLFRQTITRAFLANVTTPAPVTQSKYGGFFDKIVESRAEGWAYDPSNPKRRLVVEILEGSRVVARGIADGFRDDLLDAGVGDGRYSYKLEISAELQDGNPHYLIARIADSHSQLPIDGGGENLVFQRFVSRQEDFEVIPYDQTMQAALKIVAEMRGSVAEQQAVLDLLKTSNLGLETSEFSLAENGFKELQNKTGEQSLWYCKFGELCLYAHRLTDAAENYRKAIACSPEFAWAHYGFGEASRLLGNWQAAETAYRSADALGINAVKDKLKSVSLPTRKSLANKLLADGKIDEAIFQIKKTIFEFPDDIDSGRLLRKAISIKLNPEASILASDEIEEFEVAQLMLSVMLEYAESFLGNVK
jgi:tetratricopeptide (TPR) repeat protein